MTDSEIDKFLAETDAFDDFPSMKPPSLSPFLNETVTNTIKSPMPSPADPNQNLLLNTEEKLLQHYSAAQNTQLLPTYQYPSQNPLISTNEIQSYQPPSYKHPLASNFNFETKLPTIGSSSKFANSFEHVMNHNDKEGFMSFYRYREICSIQYGGHMSSHSKINNKRKQELEDIEVGRSNKAKCIWIPDSFSSNLSVGGNIKMEIKKDVELKLEDDDVEDQNEIKWESDESVTSEFRVGDYINID